MVDGRHGGITNAARPFVSRDEPFDVRRRQNARVWVAVRTASDLEPRSRGGIGWLYAAQLPGILEPSAGLLTARGAYPGLDCGGADR